MLGGSSPPGWKLPPEWHTFTVTRIFPGWTLDDIDNSSARFLDMSIAFDAMLKDIEVESMERARRRHGR